MRPLMSVNSGLSSIWMSPMTNLSARSPTETSDSFSAISSFVATEKVFGSVSVPMPVIRLASRRAGKASTSACVVSVKFPS